ncbi:hypothetical protein GCM10007417_23810 [Glycocaulis alkaliphilus]|nr:hypothetical protein GCM10007417_23810 [Glycocaulis alkaliphilus]
MPHTSEVSGSISPTQTNTAGSSDIDARLLEAAGDDGRGALLEAASFVAQAEVSDALVTALKAYGQTLEDLRKAGGPDPATVSRLANGRMGKKGATVATLAHIALAMGKSLRISIE